MRYVTSRKASPSEKEREVVTNAPPRPCAGQKDGHRYRHEVSQSHRHTDLYPIPRREIDDLHTEYLCPFLT